MRKGTHRLTICGPVAVIGREHLGQVVGPDEPFAAPARRSVVRRAEGRTRCGTRRDRSTRRVRGRVALPSRDAANRDGRRRRLRWWRYRNAQRHGETPPRSAHPAQPMRRGGPGPWTRSTTGSPRPARSYGVSTSFATTNARMRSEGRWGDMATEVDRCRKVGPCAYWALINGRPKPKDRRAQPS